MLVAGEMPWLDIYVHMQVNHIFLSATQQNPTHQIYSMKRLFINVLIHSLSLMDVVDVDVIHIIMRYGMRNSGEQ